MLVANSMSFIIVSANDNNVKDMRQISLQNAHICMHVQTDDVENPPDVNLEKAAKVSSLASSVRKMAK